MLRTAIKIMDVLGLVIWTFYLAPMAVIALWSIDWVLSIATAMAMISFLLGYVRTSLDLYQ